MLCPGRFILVESVYSVKPAIEESFVTKNASAIADIASIFKVDLEHSRLHLFALHRHLHLYFICMANFGFLILMKLEMMGLSKTLSF